MALPEDPAGAAAPVGILLAAGRGRRFDPDGVRNKLLHPLPDGVAVVVASARHLQTALGRVVAVVRPGDVAVAGALRALGCDVTVSDDADLGMGASLAHAIGHSLPAPHGWVVALGDMPFVQPATVRLLCAALAQGAAIAVPEHAGRRGNPVAFGAVHRDALLALHGDEGARRLVRSAPVRAVPVDDAGVLRDIDLAGDV